MPPNPTSELALLDEEPGAFAFYSWQNLLLVCWPQQATGPAVERLARVREAVDREHPEGLSVIYLIAGNAGLPTPEARAGVQQQMDQYQGRRACLALLVLGKGFGVSAQRGAITGVRMQVPGQFPMLVASEIDEVVEWLPEHHLAGTGVRVGSGELRAVLQRLSATL